MGFPPVKFSGRVEPCGTAIVIYSLSIFLATEDSATHQLVGLISKRHQSTSFYFCEVSSTVGNAPRPRNPSVDMADKLIEICCIIHHDATLTSPPLYNPTTKCRRPCCRNSLGIGTPCRLSVPITYHHTSSFSGCHSTATDWPAVKEQAISVFGLPWVKQSP